jgi:hypothetical protein
MDRKQLRQFHIKKIIIYIFIQLIENKKNAKPQY